MGQRPPAKPPWGPSATQAVLPAVCCKVRWLRHISTGFEHRQPDSRSERRCRTPVRIQAHDANLGFSPIMPLMKQWNNCCEGQWTQSNIKAQERLALNTSKGQVGTFWPSSYATFKKSWAKNSGKISRLKTLWFYKYLEKSNFTIESRHVMSEGELSDTFILPTAWDNATKSDGKFKRMFICVEIFRLQVFIYLPNTWWAKFMFAVRNTKILNCFKWLLNFSDLHIANLLIYKAINLQLFPCLYFSVG